MRVVAAQVGVGQRFGNRARIGVRNPQALKARRDERAQLGAGDANGSPWLFPWNALRSSGASRRLLDPLGLYAVLQQQIVHPFVRELAALDRLPVVGFALSAVTQAAE